MVTMTCAECDKPAVATWQGLFSRHEVCLYHAQRHINIGMAGAIEWHEPLPNGSTITKVGM